MLHSEGSLIMLPYRWDSQLALDLVAVTYLCDGMQSMYAIQIVCSLCFLYFTTFLFLGFGL